MVSMALVEQRRKANSDAYAVDIENTPKEYRLLLRLVGSALEALPENMFDIDKSQGTLTAATWNDFTNALAVLGNPLPQCRTKEELEEAIGWLRRAAG